MPSVEVLRHALLMRAADEPVLCTPLSDVYTVGSIAKH